MTEIQTPLGMVRGRERRGCELFLGIRYGKSTGGARRFRAPEPVDPWDGVYDATHFAASAPQPPRAADSVLPKRDLRWDEDCLFLNVYTPSADAAGRPVLFWVHGGSYLNGSGDAYDGSSFATSGDIVVITVNYRLGALGFTEFGHLDPNLAGSHNNGVRDCIEALRWVRSNISAFGGDPSQVTICGESAGAGLIHALLASPDAAGLFHQAISESAPARFSESETEFADALRTELGGEAGPVSLEELLATPADKILETQTVLVDRSAAAMTSSLIPAKRPGFRPVLDGITITEDPADAVATHPVPLLIGTNLNEGTLWSLALPAEITDEQLRRSIDGSGHDPDRIMEAFRADHPGDSNRQLVIHMLGDTLFRTSSLAVADSQTATHSPVWVYLFTWQSQGFNGMFGAMHALEIPFVWNMDLRPWGQLMGKGEPWPADLPDRMHRAWISFVKGGDPNHDGIPEWPAYDTDTRPTMEFGGTSELLQDPLGTSRACWVE